MPKQPRREAVALGRRRATKKQQKQLDQMLAEQRLTRQARRQLRAMLLSRRLKHNVWEGVAMCPARSFIETVAAAFQDGTDIPLELPFFTAMSMVSAFLLSRGASIDLRGQILAPALWNVVLAPSGAGKTFASTQLRSRTGADIPMFPDSSSAARFVENLSSHNRSWFVRDEFGQFLKAIESQTHMAEIKDYMLRVYDGDPIERNLKGQSLTIDDPALCILGLTVDQTWSRCVPPESMLDGFAQRFNFIIARRDPARPVRALYDLSTWQSRLAAQWQAIEDLNVPPLYRVSDEAVSAYKEAFDQLSRASGVQLPESFVRRVMFSVIRYAVVYHVILLKDGPEIDAQDIGWAARVARRHLTDGAELLKDYGLGQLERKVLRVEELLAAARRDHRVLTPREVVRHVHGVANAGEARALMELVLEDDPTATDDELDAARGVRRRRRSTESASNAVPGVSC